MKVEHKYTSDNNFNASLTVSDNTGQRAGSTRLVHVERIDNGGDDDDDDDDDDGGGGSCEANNFFINYFNVVSYSGNTITASQSFRNCPGLQGEVRRPGGVGIREFVGDITSINGTQISINTGTLPGSTRPEPGERLNILWKP